MRTILAALMGVGFLAAPALAAEPVATTDGESPGLSLAVKDFKVSNGTVMLRFTIMNDSDKGFSSYSMLRDMNVAKNDNAAISGVYLIDVPNKKKYFVVIDTDGRCICSREVPDVAAKSSLNFWAKFPAPPDSVTKIGVVVPHFQPMDDVPLTR
jgi:hypothetical protein